MASNIAICNGALALIGAQAITNLTDPTDNASLCSRLYDASLDAVLRMHPWNFAIDRKMLAAATAAPLFGYSAAFPLPADLIRLLEVSGVTDFRIERRKILCNDTSVGIAYVFRNVNVPEYDSLFVKVLEAYLAFQLAYPLTKSATTQDAMKSLMSDMLKLAKTADAMEEPVQNFGSSTVLDVRMRAL